LTVQAFYADHFVLPLPEGHRFPMAKYAMLRERLAQEMPAIQLQEALAADEDALSLVHTPRYIQAVSQGELTPAELREIGFPWSAAMAERARRSVGGTLQAARAALFGGGVAANLAGGTHHAYADKGSGFCVFNDVAVAARQMQKAWSEVALGHGQHAAPLQVAIVDLDVHQGDGTARIFADDPSVFTLSLHGAKNFPVRKQHSDCDIELPDGCEDAAYLQALAQGLDQLTQRFKPDLILYLAGADPHEGDRLGRLAVSDAGMQARDQQVFDWAGARRVPLAMVMAGGYGRDIETTLRVQVNTYRVALAAWQRWQAAC
jgi:acetoin utilization deacetylase AcuC-like enzyme